MLPLLVEELEKYRQKRSEIIEVVFVNDGSKDKTEQLARELTRQKSGYKLISFSRNFGHQIAVTAGLDYVETDAAIIMDADLQDPLEVAGEMIDKWKEGYDVVYGVRKKREGESVFKRTTASVFYRFFRWITELDIPLDTGDFRLVSKKVIKAYQQVTEQQPFVRGLITWLGYNQIGVEYHRQSRQAGETKYPLKKMMNLAFNAITSFSEKPLRLATQVGSMLSGLAFLGIIWVLYVRLFTETTVPGWASSLLIALFMGGVQILFLGVIGAYLARIYNEVRQRPRYLVKQIWRSDS
jgi:dolichol-phosphate mannosyltransferase